MWRGDLLWMLSFSSAGSPDPSVSSLLYCRAPPFFFACFLLWRRVGLQRGVELTELLGRGAGHDVEL